MIRRAFFVIGTLFCLGFTTSSLQAQVIVHRVQGKDVALRSVDTVLMGEHVRIEGFDSPIGKLDLELDRIEPFLSGAQLVLGTAEGDVPMEDPGVVILSGIVAGDADSLAYIALSPYGTNGFIRKQGKLFSVSTGPYAQDKDLAAALRTSVMEDLIDPNAGPPSACGYNAGDARLEPFGPPVVEYKQAGTQRGAGVETCRIASVAIETDWEYNERLFQGDSSAAAAYMISLMGALSEIYERDINTRLAISFLRIWDSDVDPYSPDGGDALDQVRNYWNSNMTNVDRTITHYFTGRQNLPYGGVAYVGVLCFNNFGYGVSAYLDGFFPYPLIDFSHHNWDVIVSAHEIGHNFGTGHTHSSYEPTIDDCGNGDCTNPFGGTIMSYCHICPGGLSNVQVRFHPRVIDHLLTVLDETSCDLISEGVTAADDLVFAIQETPVEIDPMGNDLAQSCDPFVYNTHDAVSENGGTIERLAGQGPDGRDMFRYTPAAGYYGMDTFQYSILGDQGVESATVSVDIREMYDAVEPADPIPGLRLSYYEIDESVVSLPDFNQLQPYEDDVTSSVSYVSTDGFFINSGLFDLIAIVFEGYVYADQQGDYTFWTESNDGSKLYVNDVLVVDNDGIHDMQRRSGRIALREGWHELRIEYFEYANSAGIFASFTPPGMPEQVLSGSLLVHEAGTPCNPADINADQELNFFDVSIFLQAYLESNLDLGDINGDGQLTFFDVSTFLIAYKEGCP
jgi:hypothetical protein